MVSLTLLIPSWKNALPSLSQLENAGFPLRKQSCVKLGYFGAFINQTLYKVVLYTRARQSGFKKELQGCPCPVELGWERGLAFPP